MQQQMDQLVYCNGFIWHTISYHCSFGIPFLFQKWWTGTFNLYLYPFTGKLMFEPTNTGFHSPLHVP